LIQTVCRRFQTLQAPPIAIGFAALIGGLVGIQAALAAAAVVVPVVSVFIRAGAQDHILGKIL
jgi:hypothetical protein